MSQTVNENLNLSDDAAGSTGPAAAVAAVDSMAGRARTASRVLARADRNWKDRGLLAIAAALDAKRAHIIGENAKDLAAGRANGTSEAMLDRLKLDNKRVDGLIAALEELAGLPDPVGTVLRGQTLPNGLRLRQVHVPMGVMAPSTRPAPTSRSTLPGWH